MTEGSKVKARNSIASLKGINSSTLYLIQMYVLELESKSNGLNDIYMVLYDASQGSISEVKALSDIIEIVNRFTPKE